jgi:hypothetical protein
VLAHFIPVHALWLRAFAESAAMSRLYAGIHTRQDNKAGMQLRPPGGGCGALQLLGNVNCVYD